MLQTLTHQRALRNNPSLSYTGAALHPRCVQTDVFHVSDTNSVHTVFFCCAVTCSRVKAVLCGAWTHRGVVPDVVSAGRTFRAIAFCRLQLWPRVFQESLCNRLASHAGNVYTCLQQWDRSSWDSSSTLAGTSALPDFPTQTRNPSELHHSPFFASDSYVNDANPIGSSLCHLQCKNTAAGGQTRTSASSSSLEPVT